MKNEKKIKFKTFLNGGGANILFKLLCKYYFSNGFRSFW